MEDIQIHYSLSYKDKIIYKINLSHGVWSKLQILNFVIWNKMLLHNLYCSFNRYFLEYIYEVTFLNRAGKFLQVPWSGFSHFPFVSVRRGTV